VLPSGVRLPAVARPGAISGGLLVVWVVTASHLVNDSFTSLLSPLLPQIRDHYGVSISETAILVAILSFVGSMIQPLVGMLGDRFDRRILAAAGPVLAAAGMTTMGYAPTFAVLGLLIALGGVGSAVFHPSGAAYIAANSRPDQRGFFASIFSAGGTLGIAIGPLVATSLDLRALPLLLPVGVVMGVLSYLVTPPSHGTGRTRRLSEYGEVFRGPIRILWAVSVLRSLSTVSFSGLIGLAARRCCGRAC
jgi:FSR family fosmidomycin resistance protein-like MFS transporter